MRGSDGSKRIGRGPGPELPPCASFGRGQAKRIGRGRSEFLATSDLSGNLGWKKIPLPLKAELNRTLELETEIGTLIKPSGQKSVSLMIDSSRDSQRLTIIMDLTSGKITNAIASNFSHGKEVLPPSLHEFMVDVDGKITLMNEAAGDSLLSARPFTEVEPKASWNLAFPKKPEQPKLNYSVSLMTMNRWLSNMLKDLENKKEHGSRDESLDGDISLIRTLFKGVSENIKFLALIPK